MRPRALAVVAVAVLAATSACGVNGLSFVQDERVDIVHPTDRQEVRLPIRVSWAVKNFAVGPGRGSFGFFVDRIPPRSGKTLSWLFRGDDSCKGSDAKALCESAEFLAERSVFQTTATEFTIERVTRLTGNERRRQFHEATVVLLDETGRRIGEGAWSVQFEVKDAR